jgi:hypothetical protein
VFIQYKIEVKRPIERKVIIKQYQLVKKYPNFDINHAKEMPSNLDTPANVPPPEQAHQQPAQKQAPPPQPAPVSTQRTTDVRARAASPKLENPVQKKEVAPPAPSTSPSTDELEILSKKELKEHWGEVQKLQKKIDEEKVDLGMLMHFEKAEFSCQYMEILESILPVQADVFVNTKNDFNSSQRCSELEIDAAKKKNQLQKMLESGKVSIADYYGGVDKELGKLLAAAKFVKTNMNNPKVLKFMMGRAKIVSKEAKELKEMIAQMPK